MGEPTEPQDLSVTFPPGTVIGEHYQVVKLLGEGGMGAVLLVQDRVLSRYLALKVLRPEMGKRLESDARFRQEARMLSRLSHPNVVTIHSFGTTDDGMNYITMEYVEGSTLDYVDLEPHVLAQVMVQVCNGLAEAHSRGIVHRDIKPANILLTSFAGVSHFAKVVDFGLALVREKKGDGKRPITLTEGNKVVGTPAYMSPEQAMGRRVDARCDIYALGVVACKMLTGQLPFQADTHLEMLTAHCNDEPALPSALRPEAGFEVDGPMDVFIAQALMKDPTRRFDNVEVFGRAFVNAISRWQGTSPISSQSTLSHPILPAVGADAAMMGDEATMMHLEAAADAGSSDIAAPQVAVLFIELDQVWRAEVETPVAEVLDCLAVVSSKIEQAVTEAGGRILHPLTDRQVAMFRSHHGPQTSTESALQAALAIRSAVDAFSQDPTVPDDFRPHCRLGVDAGELYTGKADDQSDLVFGDVMLGARMTARSCETGQLAISRRAFRHVRGLFECEPLDATDPRAGQQVLGRRQAGRAGDVEIHGVPIELIGRDAEMTHLETMANLLMEQRVLQTVLLTGPAGAGKTRLVWELLERLEGQATPPWIEVGHCTAGGSQVAYEPFLDALRRRLQVTEDNSDDLVRLKAELFVRQSLAATPTELSDDDHEVVNFLAGLLGRGEDTVGDAAFPVVHGEGAQRALLFERFAHLYQRMAEVSPLVLFIDDLQWASGATRELLGYLLGHLKEHPVLVLASTRPDAREGAAAALQREHIAVGEIWVNPLTEDATEELVRHALRRLVEVPPHIVRGVSRLAEGVPLIIEETIHDLIDEGVIEVDRARWRLGARVEGPIALPKTVEQLFTGRVERLPPNLRAALEIAAVSGARFWPAQLEELAEGSLDDTALAELALRGFVRDQREVIIDGQGDYTFIQSAMREAVYSGVSRERREALHLAVAEWLEPHVRTGGTQFDGVIGRHYLAGQDPVRALTYLKRAAQHERGMYDLEAATATLEACLATLVDIPLIEMTDERREELGLQFLSDLVRLRVLTGDLQQAIEDSSQTSDWGKAQTPTARRNRAVVSIWRGWALMRLGRYAEAKAAFAPVTELLEGTEDASLTLQAATGEASTMDKLGDAPGSVALIHEAIAAYRAADHKGRDGDVHLSAAHRVLGNSQILQGNYDEATEAFDIAYQLAEAANAPEMLVDVLNGQATVHYYQGDVAQAEATFREALEIADKWDFIEHRTVLLNNLGELAWSRKEGAEALELLERAEALSRFVGMDVTLADGCRIQAEIQLHLGHLDEAEHQCIVAIDAAERVGAPHYRGPAHRTLAHVLNRRIQGGDTTEDLPDRARAALASALAAFEQGDMAQDAAAVRALQASMG